MVVTGDRDAYQLVDDGVRIMTTSRGITDTRVYDREGVIDRYGIPPELVPDFIGLKGDTSDNIPGVPGIGDKTAAELLQRFGSLENVLASVDEISGAKRKQNLIEHADDARISKQLATAKRDIPLGFDLGDYVVVEPDRSRLRDVFREFELRDPLRRLEEALGSADAAAPAPAAERSLTARTRGTAFRQLGLRLPRTAVSVAVRAPEAPEGALFAAEEGWRYGVYTGAAEVLTGEAPNPEGLVDQLNPAPVTGHDAKSLGEVPATIAHDTEVAAYLLEPARRGYPFRELCEERGLGTELSETDPAAGDALLVHALAEWQRGGDPRPRPHAAFFEDVELPADPGPASDGSRPG